MRRLAGLCVVALLCARIAAAQTAEVTHNVNLRSDPSTDNPPIRLLTPPEQVELLEPDPANGYYHVQTDEFEEGWVWGRNIRILTVTRTPTPTPSESATPTPTPDTTSTATPTPTPAGPATAIDPSWAKGTPVEIMFTTTSVLWAAKHAKNPDHLQRWALAVQTRRGHNRAAIALANKLARIAWAVWVRNATYQPPTAQPLN